ncbi:MAG TPA: PfkB family carbohydrate kinase [bacterium]|nr:PfkB family carbohydrate kinase [bacterium]
MSLTVIGTVALDSVETPFGKIEEGLGGSATHFAASASFFSPLSLVAVVGEDFPEKHVDFFKSRPIDLEGLQCLPGKTFRWKGRYEHDLNTAHTLDTQLNVLLDFAPQLNGGARRNPFLFLGNIEPSLQERVIDQMEGKPLIAMDTMNFWIKDYREPLLKTLKKVDMLVINEGEARLLADTPNLVKASKLIRALGPKTLIVKRGEYGALVFHGEEIFNAPALPLEEILDPTGAGDAFAGGLMGYLAQTGDRSFRNLRKAVIYGSVMASFIVEKFSMDRLRSLSREEIEARYRLFCELAHFENFAGAA